MLAANNAYVATQMPQRFTPPSTPPQEPGANAQQTRGLGPSALLAPDEAPPVTVENPDSASPFIVLCDHAHNRIPRRLNRLGLSEAVLRQHIAYDIGAAGVAHFLAHLLGATAIFTGYSRLVIDPNRYLTDPTSIPLISDDVFIPGNEDLTEADRHARAEEIFWPYHQHVEAILSAREAGGVMPVLIAVHSFTPELKGTLRPWHIGVLSDADRRLADPALAMLRRHGDIIVGDNEPYSAISPRGFTLERHANPQGRLHLLLEIRQDLIAAETGQRAWADRLGDIAWRLLESGKAEQTIG